MTYLQAVYQTYACFWPPRRKRLCALLIGLWCGTIPVASDPVISEFMASNDHTIVDGYGLYSDWIEIHNPDAQPISLGGLYLTDDPTDLRRWPLPSVTLQSGGYLVVFASGTDALDPAGYWHANFRLDADGEYLALVAADGVTPLSEFGSPATAYPPQRQDISFGLRQDATTLFLAHEASPAEWAVPADDRWSLDWTRLDSAVVDQSWSAGVPALGYDAGGGSGGPRPVAYWPLDQVLLGSTLDEEGLAPGIVIDAVPVPGRFASALQFDGEDDYVLVESFPALTAPDSFTVSLWFNRSVDHAGTAKDSNHAVNNILLAHSANAENDNL